MLIDRLLKCLNELWLEILLEIHGRKHTVRGTSSIFAIKYQRNNVMKKILGGILIAIVLFWVLLLMSGFPIPRGTKVCFDYNTYYRNVRGIYYISVDHALQLIEHGHWGYLKDVDEETFAILDDNWAKDTLHVWYQDEEVKTADPASFYVDKSGLPKDKNHVYVYDAESSRYRPIRCGIDVYTAEKFVYKHDGQDWTWVRDKDFVYLDETRLDVDRNTFAPLGRSSWWTDKNFVYVDSWDSSIKKKVLTRVDCLQTPVDTLNAGSQYLRNGRNIIYLDTVVVEDIDVERFEEVGISKCIVNDMLFYNGERILKDSLNVSEAKFYFYGHIAADKHHVFYGRKQLDDVDAASFYQVSNETFEDKNFIYAIKENAWNEEYPFDKKRKP